MEQNKGDAAVLAETFEELNKLEQVMLGAEGEKILVVPKGKEPVSLKKFFDEYLVKPRRRKGTSQHKTLQSLIAFANMFKSEDSVLFADPRDGKSPALVAVFNHAPAGAEATGWGDHRAQYTFPLSDEWNAWKSIDGRPMKVREFATFIEKRIEDIAAPDMAGEIAKQIPEKLGFAYATPAAILQLSKGLSVVVDHTVTNIIDPSTGERQLQFEQTHKDKAGKPMNVAKAFLLAIPVFQNGAVYTVGVRLTYEVVEGAVLFTVHLYREDLFFKDAFETACEEARAATQLPLFFGTPEQ